MFSSLLSHHYSNVGNTSEANFAFFKLNPTVIKTGEAKILVEKRVNKLITFIVLKKKHLGSKLIFTNATDVFLITARQYVISSRISHNLASIFLHP